MRISLSEIPHECPSTNILNSFEFICLFNDSSFLVNNNTKIERIEKELEELRLEYKKENDKLKEDLFQADMLIRSYES